MGRRESYTEAGMTSAEKMARARAKMPPAAATPERTALKDQVLREFMDQVATAVDFEYCAGRGQNLRNRCSKCREWKLSLEMIQARSRLVCPACAA